MGGTHGGGEARVPIGVGVEGETGAAVVPFQPHLVFWHFCARGIAQDQAVFCIGDRSLKATKGVAEVALRQLEHPGLDATGRHGAETLQGHAEIHILGRGLIAAHIGDADPGIGAIRVGGIARFEIAGPGEEHLGQQHEVLFITAGGGGIGGLGQQAEVDVEIVGAEDGVDAGHEALGREPAVAEGGHVIGDGVETIGQIGDLGEPGGRHPGRQGGGAALQRIRLTGQLLGQPVDGVDEAVHEGEPARRALRQGQIAEALEQKVDLAGQGQTGSADVGAHRPRELEQGSFAEVDGEAPLQLGC